jgi:hypothetical protein
MQNRNQFLFCKEILAFKSRQAAEAARISSMVAGGQEDGSTDLKLAPGFRLKRSQQET